MQFFSLIELVVLGCLWFTLTFWHIINVYDTGTRYKAFVSSLGPIEDDYVIVFIQKELISVSF